MGRWIGGPMVLAMIAGSLSIAGGELDAQAPERGSYGVSVNVPEGGGSGLGLRHMLREGINLGLTFEGSLEDREVESHGDESSTTEWRVALRPDLRIYRRADGTVLPFVALSTGFDYAGGGATDRWGMDVRGGVGAEWFPTAQVGLAASTGVAVAYDRRDREETDFERRAWRLDIFRSELTLNLYF